MRTSVAWIVALGGSLAHAQTTQRVSIATDGTQGNLGVGNAAISFDSRYVAFWSAASNLVPGDTNTANDIFVHDRLNGATERVSVNTAGVQGDWNSWAPSISATGRFVAFASYASNLVAGDTAGSVDIFVRDRQSGTTEIVSVSSLGVHGNQDSSMPSISADGRFVAFRSIATNLVTGDTNGCSDVFVRDRLSGTTQRVSVDSGGLQGNLASLWPSISADGTCVVFTSDATNLVASDTNGMADVFVHERPSGLTRCASVATGGALANSGSNYGSISCTGRFVAFASFATNLVSGDNNGFVDLFVHDRQSLTTERVSVASDGWQGNGDVYGSGSISADGRIVAFASHASSLIAGDTNFCPDIFLHDRLGGTTERVSLSTLGAQPNSDSYLPSISGDGRVVAFTSVASNLVSGDTNAIEDVFVRERYAAPTPTPFCFGDGTAGPCPCGNNGSPGRGCENSASTGGARLTATGTASLFCDTLALTSSGELPGALSVFLQGRASIAPAIFGDGLRCTDVFMKRLYIHNAAGGVIQAPGPGEPSISARSTALGDVISAGSARYYQTYYRDPVQGFCANPPWSTWNISSGLAVDWGY